MKKIIRKTFEFCRLIIRNYRRFGWSGVSFIIKSAVKKNQIITFSHPQYLHPIFLRNDTSDIPTFAQVINREDYNIKLNFDPKVIIDCGANIGLSTVFFRNKFPFAKIISIEPEHFNYEMLVKNTRSYPGIHCLKNGIWNKSANLLIKDCGFGNWGFMLQEVSYTNENTISAISITDIMNNFDLNQIDILKIDIEGSEKELFENNFESWLPKTKVVIIELHDRMREGCSKSFFKALCKYNFSTTYSGENLICFIQQN